MNNVDATVQKDEYGNLLGCVPPVTLGEHERCSRHPYYKADHPPYVPCVTCEHIYRNRGDK